MTNRKTKSRKKPKQKRGPKEERLVIKGDPKEAIDALLRKDKTTNGK